MESFGLVEREGLSATVLDATLDGVAITRVSDGEVLYANAALRASLGSGSSDLAEAVHALVERGRVDSVELAHPQLGAIRLVVVPAEGRRRDAERAWRRDLRRELARAHRRQWPLTITAVAVDAGASPQLAAAAWAQVLREEDSLAPHDGGIYILVLPDCPAEVAYGVGLRIRETTPPPATVSMGLATWVDDEPLESLLERALDALARARADGGDRAVIAAPPDGDSA